MNHPLLSALEAFGDRYTNEFLGDFDTEKLCQDWREGFAFFLSRAMYQGRRDEVSTKVLEAGLPVFMAIFKDSDEFPTQTLTAILIRLKADLEKVIGKGKIGKYRDIEMIISALVFVGRLQAKSHNIVVYSIDEIRAGRAIPLYHQLQPSWSSGGITQVGPKIASFFIRDLVSIFKLEPCVDEEAQFCLQPIDTWVAHICRRAGLAVEGDNHDQIRTAIATYCRERGVPPIRFNQGAWYMGKYSLELLIERLELGPSHIKA